MTKKHLFLIDAYGFLFRAYHSMPPLTRSDGTPVGAVLGFTNMLLKKLYDLHDLNKENGDTSYYAAVILDAGQKTFRNDIYPEYKANRPPAPEDLIPQFPLVREASKAMNLPTLEMVGYEADDLIATYARLGKESGMKVTIISSDKDLMQLVEDGKIAMYDAAKDRRIEAKEVEEKFGVPPSQVLDALAMIGDSSDNVPGIPGIGPKTAAELLKTYGSLDELIKNAAQIKQEKRRQSIIENADKARLSRKLIKLCDTVPVKATLEDLIIRDPDNGMLLKFLRQQEFKALIARVEKQLATEGKEIPVTQNAGNKPAEKRAPKESVKENYQLITNEKDLRNWLAQVVGKLTILVEKEAGNPFGASLCRSEGNACYISINMEIKPAQATLDLLGSADNSIGNKISIATFTSLLRPYMDNSSILKIGHDIKSLPRELLPETADDVMVMSYVLDGAKTSHDLSSLSEQHLGISLALPEEFTDKKIKLAEIDSEKLYKNFCKRADAAFRLHALFRQRLFDEHMLNIYETIERPLVNALARMEHYGVKIDPAVLKSLSEYFSGNISRAEKEIFALAGEEFNIASPKQLGEVLFEHMGIQGGKKSKKSGAYSTGSDVLEELSLQGHTIADKILYWRQLSKLKSTYTDALQEEINPKTGRVHTTFAMTVASTGRLSSINPNLQNIPIRTDEGRKIRTAFVAEKGNKLISADYSQIELRLLASVANIKELKQAFAEGIDIHALTASQVFGVPLEKVDPKLRYSAKAINFGIIYGQSAFGLASGLGISRGDAKQYIDKYFKQYPGILEYMENIKEYAREHGYVQTLYGRKCFMPGIHDKNHAIRAFAERAAINAPLQGSAADIIKKAMIKLDAKLPRDAKMILQIHDELLVEAPSEKAEEIAKLMKKIMESAHQSDIPFTVEAKIGNNWGEIH